jgi:putative SOS response-associated peptidase YedK
MRWGLLSREAKTEKSVKTPINARAESILVTWPFTEAIRSRRCMVPVNGFYEWKKLEKGVREPYAIGLKTGETFCFAGIWEEWVEPVASVGMRVQEAAEGAQQRKELQGISEPADTLFPLTPPPQNNEIGRDPDADPTPRVLETFAIITCDANEVVV